MEELIQNLWQGYGTLKRVSQNGTTVIKKEIAFPPNPHPRKVKSYQVENYWYQNYNKKIEHAYYPRHIKSSEGLLVLEDLETLGFYPKQEVSWDEVKLCLKWLAHFHKSFMNVEPEGLWNIGTYWHLKTRPDEWKAMSDSELQNAASLIDKKLNHCTHKTIVHGDAKLANFLFSEDAVAAVDFQYVGSGCGIKDVAYFLSSIYLEDELATREKECLDYYFQELDVPEEIENEWRNLYPFAWADFYRFLNGWKPGHYKVHEYSKKMRDQVLACL
jgi:thiamine kinase-like enzyme